MFFSHPTSPNQTGGAERLKLQSYRSTPYHYSQTQRKTSPTEGKKETPEILLISFPRHAAVDQKKSHTSPLMCYSGQSEKITWCFLLSLFLLNRISRQNRTLSIQLHLPVRSLVLLHTEHFRQHALLVLITALTEHRGCCCLLFELLLFLSGFLLFSIRNNANVNVASRIYSSVVEQRSVGFASQSLVSAPSASSGDRSTNEQQSFNVAVTERARECIRFVLSFHGCRTILIRSRTFLFSFSRTSFVSLSAYLTPRRRKKISINKSFTHIELCSIRD